MDWPAIPLGRQLFYPLAKKKERKWQIRRMNLLTLQWGLVITKHEFTPTAGYTDYLLGHPDGGASWKRNVITTIQAGEPKRPLTCRPTTISPHTNVVRVDGGKLPVALQPCPSSSFAQ